MKPSYLSYEDRLLNTRKVWHILTAEYLAEQGSKKTVTGRRPVAGGPPAGTLIIELTQLNFNWNCQLELSLTKMFQNSTEFKRNFEILNAYWKQAYIYIYFIIHTQRIFKLISPLLAPVWAESPVSYRICLSVRSSVHLSVCSHPILMLESFSINCTFLK